MMPQSSSKANPQTHSWFPNLGCTKPATIGANPTATDRPTELSDANLTSPQLNLTTARMSDRQRVISCHKKGKSVHHAGCVGLPPIPDHEGTSPCQKQLFTCENSNDDGVIDTMILPKEDNGSKLSKADEEAMLLDLLLERRRRNQHYLGSSKDNQIPPTIDDLVEEYQQQTMYHHFTLAPHRSGTPGRYSYYSTAIPPPPPPEVPAAQKTQSKGTFLFGRIPVANHLHQDPPTGMGTYHPIQEDPSGSARDILHHPSCAGRRSQPITMGSGYLSSQSGAVAASTVYPERGVQVDCRILAVAASDATSSNFNKAVAAKKRTKKPKGMPRGPLNAYRMFFRAERVRILKELKEPQQRQEEKNRVLHETGMTAPSTDTTTINPFNLPPKNRSCSQARKNRKTNGTIRFQDLTRLVGQRWKKVSTVDRQYYQSLAEEDSQRQKAAMAEYHQRIEQQQQLQVPAATNDDDDWSVLSCTHRTDTVAI